MRILVVNNFYPPRVGGSAHLSDALARGYAEEGHDVLVLTASYEDAPATEQLAPRLRVVRLPSSSLPQTRLSVSFDIAFTARPSLRRRVRQLLDEFRPDVIHQHGQFFDLSWATGLYARNRGVPVLLSVHTRLENPQAHYHGVFRWLDRLMVRPIMRRYLPRVVVMDVQMDEYIKSRYAGAYSGLEYIPVGVDPSRMVAGDGKEVRTRHELGDVPLVVSLGHVIPLRDRVTLVEAMPALLARVPTARLLVVGHVYYDLFQRRARELGVDHALLSIGSVDKTAVPDYLAAADVEAHDLQGYGMGTATLESMASGVPVVVAVRPDNFPGIDLGGRCVVVPVGRPEALADALAELLTDRALADRTGAAGRELVREHFAMDVVLRQHLDVLAAMTSAVATP